MATVQDYLRKLSTTQLQALLREECEGRGDLPVEAILQICEILSDRESQRPTVKDILLRLCREYLS